jgi:hypothetical protein
MLLEQLRNRVDNVFTPVLNKWGHILPFKGRYIIAVRDAVLSQIEGMQTQWQSFFDKTSGNASDAEVFIDFLIDNIKGKIKLPFPVSLILWPMQGQLLESLKAYLKANLPKVRDQIGQVQQ